VVTFSHKAIYIKGRKYAYPQLREFEAKSPAKYTGKKRYFSHQGIELPEVS
jgi:hypothetical protein